MQVSRRVVLAGAMASLMGAMSCKSDSSTSPTNDIRDFITSVANSTGSLNASFHAGAAPTEGSGPVATVSGSSAFILGGGALRTVSSGTAFTRVIVAIDGVDGYWELTVPSTTSQGLTLTLAQTIPDQSFTVEYGAGTAASIGTFDTEPVSVIQVGTGDIQVSVSWDAPTDVDLHLVEPGTSGEEIYYGNPTSAAGGELDLDSNAGCGIDGKNNENITYPTAAPPHGTYTVRLDYWSSCSQSATKYLVTVRVKGQAVKTFSGTFTGAGDSGGQGDGILITTFTY